MNRKNRPEPFPYGQRLQAIFDGIYEEAEIFFEKGRFKNSHHFEPLTPENAYIRCGNDVYHARDELQVKTALDIRNAGLLLPLQGHEHTPMTELKLDHYGRFAPAIARIIAEEQLRDPDGHPLSVGEAFKAYGDYRWQQIERFDARNREALQELGAATGHTH